jgi:hypothetical protein
MNNPSRGTRPSVSAVLIVGLLIGVTASAFKPGFRTVARDSRAEGVATRHITAALTRAVRDLVGVKRETPAIPVLAGCRRPQVERSKAVIRILASESNGPAMLRESLIAMPPPVA